MKKIWLIALALVLSCCRSSTDVLRPEKVFEDAKGSNEKIKSGAIGSYESIKNSLNFLASDALKGRKTGSPEIEEAANFIEGIFKEYNLKPYFESYKDTLSNLKIPAYNVVGYLEGNDSDLKKEFIIIGAHYDHIGFAEKINNDTIANGANDNASGTSAVLELAKYFGQNKKTKRSLLFVLFAAEEMGLLGSKHLAKKLKERELDLYAMVNFEMIGVPLKGKDYLAYVTGYEKSNMAAKFNEYTDKNTIGFLPSAKENLLFQRSDNYPFYKEFKVPSQTICTFDFTNFDYYHHVDDEIGEMDLSHMVYVINEIIPAFEKMANAPTKEIKLD
ncbi:M28 family metallopeptidase [Ascidiimonas sp. W6]|uniref:M28 family metallopeptidase n=1 Tax=Ascidiimonas meishanensis TaxID=3128903 RepID=UPI0030EF1B92